MPVAEKNDGGRKNIYEQAVGMGLADYRPLLRLQLNEKLIFEGDRDKKIY